MYDFDHPKAQDVMKGDRNATKQNRRHWRHKFYDLMSRRLQVRQSPLGIRSCEAEVIDEGLLAFDQIVDGRR